MKDRTEFLFAHWAVPMLKDLRGPKWRALVENVARLPDDDPDSLAFALTMIRMNSCANCSVHRFQERGGCAACSRFVLTSLSRETETGLLTRFNAAQKEIHAFIHSFAYEKKAA
ncbi:MAG: hypothetical protein HZB51_07890 [Chloroflexi bacterium]|nr:hypothetical protein [Chloroflexota bacterium]